MSMRVLTLLGMFLLPALALAAEEAVKVDPALLLGLATVAGAWIASWATKKFTAIRREHIPKLAVVFGGLIMAVVEFAVFKNLTISGLINAVLAGGLSGLAAVGLNEQAAAVKRANPKP